MAETQAKIGFGLLLQYGDGNSPELFTTVAEVINEIAGPGLQRDTPEATHMQSPDGYREFLGGLKDGQDVTFDCNFLPHDDSQLDLRDIFESGVRRHWRLQLPQFSPAAELEFSAIVQAFEFNFPLAEAITFSATLKVTGKPAFVEV